jgi:hypothetical protein
VLPRDGGLARLSRRGAVGIAERDGIAVAHRGVTHRDRDRLDGGPQRHPLQHVPADRRADLQQHQRLCGADRRLQREPARAVGAPDGATPVGATPPAGQEGDHRDLARRRRRRHLYQQDRGAAGPADPASPTSRYRSARSAASALRASRCRAATSRPIRASSRRCRPRRALLVQPGSGDLGADRDVLVLDIGDSDLHQRRDARRQIFDPRRRDRHHQRPQGELRHAGFLRRQPRHHRGTVPRTVDRSGLRQGSAARTRRSSSRAAARRWVPPTSSRRCQPDLSVVRFARYGANYIPRNTPVLADVDDINNNIGFWRPQADFRIPERLSPGFTGFPDVEIETMFEDMVKTFVRYQGKYRRERAIKTHPDARPRDGLYRAARWLRAPVPAH